MILLGYLSLSDLFLPVSEMELGGGYGDLILVLDRRYRDASYNFLLELKYVPVGRQRAGGKGPQPGAVPRTVASALDQAEEQVRRYLADPRLEGLKSHGTWRAVMVAFHGTQAIYVREPGGATRRVG